MHSIVSALTISPEELETMPKKIEEEIVEESDAKKKFRALIEAYRIKNPVKYETKKKVLEEQLNAL